MTELSKKSIKMKLKLKLSPNIKRTKRILFTLFFLTMFLQSWSQQQLEGEYQKKFLRRAKDR